MRVTAKYVASCDLDSQDILWQAVNKIEVPTWYVDVHMHKHIVSRQVHEAAALLVPPERKQLKAYADDIVIACSKTRKWYLHSRDRFLRDARRCTIWLFSVRGGAKSLLTCSSSPTCLLQMSGLPDVRRGGLRSSCSSRS